jgi:uncharacterized zinc-type alcohol dehydrogenase-like protein
VFATRSSDEASMAAAAKSLDLILDTVSAVHDVNAEGSLLATDGTIVLLGLSTVPVSYAVPNFLFSRHTVTGSLIGAAPSPDCELGCAGLAAKGCLGMLSSVNGGRGVWQAA